MMKTQLIERQTAQAAPVARLPSPRISGTVRKIYEAARIEFAAHGVDESRVSDIATRAGVTKQLIYYHFRSKEDLYVAVIDENARAAIAALMDRDYEQQPPCKAIRSFLHDVYTQYSDTPFQKLSLSERCLNDDLHLSTRNVLRSLLPALVDKVDGILQRGAMIGVFQSGVDAGLFLGTALSLMYGCFMTEVVMTVVVDKDIGTRQGQAAWVDHCATLLLSTIDTKNAPHTYARAPVSGAVSVRPN